MTEQTGAAVPEAQREVIITRVFDAPARLLFEAYAKPEHVKRWFGPRGWPLTLVEMDFREGGKLPVRHDRSRWHPEHALRR